jgi:hypothetical protein
MTELTFHSSAPIWCFRSDNYARLGGSPQNCIIVERLQRVPIDDACFAAKLFFKDAGRAHRFRHHRPTRQDRKVSCSPT